MGATAGSGPHPRPGHGLPGAGPCQGVAGAGTQQARPGRSRCAHVLVYVSTRDAGRVMVTMSLRNRSRSSRCCGPESSWTGSTPWSCRTSRPSSPGDGREVAVRPRPARRAGSHHGARSPGFDDAVAGSPGSAPRSHASRTPESGTCGFRPSTTSTKRWCSRRSTPGRMNPWIDHPDSVAEWMASSGVGAYPPVFVGRLASDAARRDAIRNHVRLSLQRGHQPNRGRGGGGRCDHHRRVAKACGAGSNAVVAGIPCVPSSRPSPSGKRRTAVSTTRMRDGPATHQ